MSGWQDPRDQDPREPELPRWIFLHSLRVSIGRTSVWLTHFALIAALAAAAAAPWFGFYDSAFAHRFEPGSIVRELDETVRFDLRSARDAMDAASRGWVGVLSLVAMLVGAFTAGGWLQVFLEHTHGESVRRFFSGGARFFFRFVRVLLMTLVVLQLLGWLIYGRPWEWLVLEHLLGLDKPDLAELTSEAVARRTVFIQDGVYAALFALVLTWADFTRTRIAAQGGRSVVWAGMCCVATIVLHPIRVLRPLLLIWLAEAGVLAVAWLLIGQLEGSLGPGSSKWPILGMFALGAGVLAWRTILRGARYSACVLVTRDVVRPLTRPDPWKRSIGGPGGPRYPIDGDEYGVAL
jgi:hypothetical protein